MIDIDENSSELTLNVEEMETSPIRDRIVENSDDYHSSIMQVICLAHYKKNPQRTFYIFRTLNHKMKSQFCFK